MLKALSRYGKHIASAISGEAYNPLLKPTVLFKFDTAKEVDKWHVFADSYFGGRSSATFELAPSQQCAVFSGHCTLDQEEDAELRRGGFCSASSKVTSWGDYYSLERYSHLVYSVRGDGRTYIANLRTDSLADGSGDVWQAPFKTRPGEWLDVHIPLSSFMMTVQGQVTQDRFRVPKDRIISVGVAVCALDEAPPQAFDVFKISQKMSSDESGAASSSVTSSSSRSSSEVASSSTGDASSSSSNSSSSSTVGVSATDPASSASSREAQVEVDRQPPGFDFRLEVAEVRAECSIDPAAHMY